MAWLRSLINALIRLSMPHPAPTPQPEPKPAEKPHETPVKREPTKAEVLYDTAKSFLGRDNTPSDVIPDEVACVEHCQWMIFKALGFFVGNGAARYNTFAFNKALDVHNLFESILLDEALPGDIAVAPTGMGTNPYEHGHCWIVGKTHWMSNDSATGLWQANYTKDQVIASFAKKRGFPIYVYRPI